MKVSRVSIPIVKYRHLRRAEPGQVLAEDVFDREDNLVAEVGTELTEKHLRRFKNFNVRQIAVEDTMQRWIRSERRDDLPARTSVLISDTLRGYVEDFGEMILSATSPAGLSAAAEQIKRNLEIRNRDDHVGNIESIGQKLAEFDDEMADVKSRIEEFERDDIRRELNAFLGDPGFHLAGTLLNLDASESVIRTTIKTGIRYERLRGDLMEEIRGFDDTDSATESDDGDETIPVETFEEDVQSSLREFGEGNMIAGIEDLRETIDARGGESQGSLEDQLDNLLSSYEAVSEDAAALKHLMEESGSQRLWKLLAAARDNPARVPPRTLLSVTERDDELSDRLLEFIKKRFRSREKLWSVLNECTDGELADTISQESFFELMGPEATDTEAVPEEVGSLLGQKTREVLLLVKDNQPVRAVNLLLDHLSADEIADRLGEGILTELREDFEALKNDISDLEDRVRDEVESTTDRSALLTVLEEPAEFAPDALPDVDANEGLLESIETCLTEYNRKMETLKSYLDELTGDQF